MGDAFKVYQGEVNMEKLGEIINAGDVVGIKVSPETEWITDLVENVRPESNTVEIRLLEDFIDQDLLVDDVIQCRIMKEDTEYVFEAKVDDIGIIDPQKIMLGVSKIVRFDNARNSKRYTVNLCGRVTYAESEKAAFVTIKNISKTGLSITCRECLGINEEVDVDIILWKQEVLSTEGRIVRMYKVGKNYKYGIVIDNIDSRSQELLDDFIDELERKEKEIQK